jgi:glycosyltransferase involved in cell wall biosynthesis
MERRPLLSVIILTYNEEVNLPACLESLKGLDCEIFVVDSGSTDRTIEIARSYGAHVVEHPFETQARQLNWALQHLPLKGEWVLRLDADERLTPELKDELSSTLPTLESEITGLYVKRRVYFLGRWIRHGGYYPIWLLRVWRKGCARSEDRQMDEHMVLVRGRADFLRHDIVEQNQKGLFEWIERQNRYSSRESVALMSGCGDEIAPKLFGTPEARRRWLKYSVYLRFPALVRAFVYFAYRYVFRLGFLDGKEGLIFHFLQGCWYRFLIDAKLFEAQKGNVVRTTADRE